MSKELAIAIVKVSLDERDDPIFITVAPHDTFLVVKQRILKCAGAQNHPLEDFSLTEESGVEVIPENSYILELFPESFASNEFINVRISKKAPQKDYEETTIASESWNELKELLAEKELEISQLKDVIKSLETKLNSLEAEPLCNESDDARLTFQPSIESIDSAEENDSASNNLQEELDEVENLPLLILSLEEDSPFHRKSILDAEELVWNLERSIKNIVKMGLLFCSSGKEFNKITKEFCSILGSSFECVESPEERNMMLSLHQSFMNLSKVLLEIENLQSLFIFSFENVFIRQIKEIGNEAFKKCHRSSLTVNKAQESYETLLSKHLSHRTSRHTDQTAVLELSEKVRVSLDVFKTARADHVNNLNETLILTKMEIIESVCASFYAILSFFHSGHDVAAVAEPFSRNLQVLLTKRKELYLNNQFLPSLAKFTGPIFKQTSSEKRTIEGYLFKLSSGIKKDWKRRWFVIKDGVLFYCRSAKDTHLNKVLDIVLCSTRATEEYDRKFVFEIISPNRKKLVLQTESESALNDWINSIRNSAENILVGSDMNQRASNYDILDEKRSTRHDQSISSIRVSNPTCADCNSRDPDWLSTNFGIVICIECSGIHRGLGVQISKVKSICLDKLESELYQLVLATGNLKFNRIWEAKLQSESETLKPNAQSLSPPRRDQREAFITAKYLDRRFVDVDDIKLQFEDKDSTEVALRAIESGDINPLFQLMALGIQLKSIKVASRNLLHFAALSGKDDVAISELLLQNGVKASDQDDDGKTPLEIARELSLEQLISQLEKRNSFTSYRGIQA